MALSNAEWHGPRLCSAALKERRHSASKTRVNALMASGARDRPYRTTPEVNPAFLRGGLISFFRKQRASRPV